MLELLVPLSVAALTVGGTLAVTLITDRRSRLAASERRNERLERDNRLLWLWSRQLVDHIYRGSPPPPPGPPPELFGDPE